MKIINNLFIIKFFGENNKKGKKIFIRFEIKDNNFIFALLYKQTKTEKIKEKYASKD